ncbi:MAG: HAMP domain-containing histidine kinase [Proteobacteria bacterium]|nr:HAMP domain-containing histidine kinase [Pseudomonadota bacterium]MBU4583028.1 HAMP domain-containing histidine kinase [Pseudomonadota bacterium]MCG2739031.1 HAMP domain-containing histidine kinase [Syntrophaceae bacterium]
MKQAKWFFHPVFIFVLSTVALAISLFLYIYWYIGVSENLKSVVRRYQLDGDQFFEAKTWVVILILSLLVGVILVGIIIIFIYNLKTLQLYRLQHTFINNFTHELKTPVTSMKIYLETFEKYQLSREEQLKYIGFMLHDTERLSGNINSILNLARIESRLHEGEPTPVDLSETIRQFVIQNRHLFRDCDIQVAPPVAGPLICPLIVPLFEMLLMNILTNAIKYNTSGKPRIDITFEQDRHSLWIRFRDNGIGILKEERKMIFNKFYQGRHDERVPVGGSGIGLYLVQQIARLHQGKVAADSEGAGKGSVFTLTLPAIAPK